MAQEVDGGYGTASLTQPLPNGNSGLKLPMREEYPATRIRAARVGGIFRSFIME
jgi:hypothetical protein